MSKILALRGLPASGKSTFAREWVADRSFARARVNRDDLRLTMFGQYSGLSRQEEAIVTNVETEMVKALLKDGRDVVVDAMHLRPRYVRKWDELARELGAELEIKEFEISVDESKNRNRERETRGERSVPWQAIQDMGRRYLQKDPVTGRRSLMPYEPLPEAPKVEVEKYVADETKPWAIIVDIDGTVALHTSGRNPYDLSRVSEDTPNEPVLDLIATEVAGSDYISGSEVEVIFLSAREDSCRKDTVDWLSKHAPGANWSLLMRKAGDGRKDAIVKREIFDEHIRHNYRVKYVLDDRNSVVEMWRSLGLTCLQVAPGDF